MHIRKLAKSLKPKLSDDKSKEKDFKEEAFEVLLDSAMEYYGKNTQSKR